MNPRLVNGPWKAQLAVAILGMTLHAGAADDERHAKQDRLDAECEAARQAALAPERAQHVDECVRDKMKETREDCERFYRDYGERSGRRPALYYGLPECVSAFRFREESPE